MNWRRYRLIVWKELRQFRRDPLLLRIVFIMPILQLIMFGYVVGADVTNVKTAVVDHDKTATSRELVRAFESSNYFTIVSRPDREADLKPLLDSTTAQVAIVIDAGTEAALTAGRTVPVGIVVDGADSKTASVASSYAAQTIAEFNDRRLALQMARVKGPKLDSRVRVVFNPSMKAVNAMIPGLIATVLMISVMSIMSQAVVRERARGTLEQMMVTPLTRGEYLLGKITPYVGIAIVQMSFVAAIGRFWFQVPFNGNIVTVAVGLGIFTFTSIGMGLLVSLVSKTQQQAQQMTMFVLLPSMVLSGFMFPIESMPANVVPLTYFIPLRYALVVLRASFLKGATIPDLVVPLGAMVAFSVLIFGIAITRFSRTLGE
ncbi:MAG: ABC transporter permease [Coriobacteriia bacterium]|nr:ABC transporter permease [Coriobacteriia bacterium]